MNRLILALKNFIYEFEPVKPLRIPTRSAKFCPGCCSIVADNPCPACTETTYPIMGLNLKKEALHVR